MKSLLDNIKGGIFGVAVGDALGVPVEFKSREFLKKQPVTDFMGYMCWNQPPGTWSDDTSLTLCLVDSLIKDYDVEDIAKTFAKWYTNGYWGAHNEVFDIGGSTRYSLDRVLKGESGKYSGNMFETDNGNGSLMRTLPLVFFLQKETDSNKRYQKIKEVSSITHAHFRSVFSCFIYVEYALLLLQGQDKFVAYENMKKPLLEFAYKMDFNPIEIDLFHRILKGNIFEESKDFIQSSGYVLHSLEASLWCLLTSDSYEESVLKAVNLGGDTDTTGAITGGLAGLYYGYNTIPETWKFQLAKFEDIEELLKKFNKSLS
ncbi:ADP-ribosylglycohydrolase family protein [Aquimarina muelleri]|uniref:ADP-ribosylglycohydrolase family protein n=1 Tax=Aquimarina muelleri TaxID=279356 RepID=UPI003F68548E